MLDTTSIFDGTLNTGLTPPTGAAITASRVSTNVLDLLVARDLGAGDIIGIHVDVTVAFATLTSLVIDFEVCDTVGGTYLNILSSPVLPVAQLIAGAPLFRYAWPLNQLLNATAGVLKAPARYARLNYTVAGSNATTGAVFSYANAMMDRQQYYTYPENYVTA